MTIKKKQSYWSQEVTEHSDAMNLESGVFKKKSPRAIALSLKRSVLASNRTKGTKFQSAMSMLNFYINRAGSRLSQEDRHRLEQAKEELRIIFKKDKPLKKS